MTIYVRLKLLALSWVLSYKTYDLLPYRWNYSAIIVFDSMSFGNLNFNRFIASSHQFQNILVTYIVTPDYSSRFRLYVRIKEQLSHCTTNPVSSLRVSKNLFRFSLLFIYRLFPIENMLLDTLLMNVKDLIYTRPCSNIPELAQFLQLQAK